jgi:nondiscriminating glutamyl-tRNA synthetase
MLAAIDKNVRVRFPPSPTGHWHLGGARTALFNWLFTRQRGGKFILRIEDTDRERSQEKYEIEIVETMKWLGLDWDEGPDWQMVNHQWQTTSRGEYGPYRQSERLHIYRRYLEKLLSEGKAYFCYCSREELEAQREALIAAGLPPKYGGHCRELTSPPPGKMPQVIRFKMPEAELEFTDVIRGRVKFDLKLFGDIAIARNLDSPLYNFAVVVDDYEMQISHVIRGEEHLPNTPKQIVLARALGFPEPVFAHLPLILSPDRKKLSKRFMETSLLEYRKEGYLPEAIVNFLVLLGWHPRGDREIFSLSELILEFDLKRVQKAGAVFDPEKLDWLNAQYIRKLPLEELVTRLEPQLKERGVKASKKMIKKLAEIERERMKKLSDFTKLTGFFFKLPDYEPKLLIWKDDSPITTKEILQELLSLFEKTPAKDFEDGNKLNQILAQLAETRGKGSVFWPLRAALSGQAASPDPIKIMEILGKKEIIARLTLAINKIGLAL